MKNRIFKITAIIVSLALICSIPVSSTAGESYPDFGTYVLLGDSVASGYNDLTDLCAPFVKAARELIKNSDANTDIINSVIDLADTMDALPSLLFALPIAVVYGIVNYVKNWDRMIEDIYALNPDVNLLVIGMFDNSIKTQEDADKSKNTLISLSIGQTIVDLANLPMKLSAEKYGYVFVDTTGTVCDTYHPTYDGHAYIAERILEAISQIPESGLPSEGYDRLTSPPSSV